MRSKEDIAQQYHDPEEVSFRRQFKELKVAVTVTIRKLGTLKEVSKKNVNTVAVKALAWFVPEDIFLAKYKCTIEDNPVAVAGYAPSPLHRFNVPRPKAKGSKDEAEPPKTCVKGAFFSEVHKPDCACWQVEVSTAVSVDFSELLLPREDVVRVGQSMDRFNVQLMKERRAGVGPPFRVRSPGVSWSALPGPAVCARPWPGPAQPAAPSGAGLAPAD